MFNGIGRQCLIKNGLTVKREPPQGNLEIIERCTLVRGYPTNIEYVHFQILENIARESQKFKGSHCQHNFDTYLSEWQRGKQQEQKYMLLFVYWKCWGWNLEPCAWYASALQLSQIPTQYYLLI